MCIPRFNGAMKPAMRRPFYYTSYRWLCASHRNNLEKNYYEVLGVRPDATVTEIKSAFYELSKKYHPDATRNSLNSTMQTAMYLEIKDAYEVLKDKKRRREYDLELTGASTSRREYQAASRRRSQSYTDPSNFYARTPRYDNEQWFEWYQRRRSKQMEERWGGRGSDDDWVKTIMAFFLAFFVFSMVVRIRDEHIRRKRWIEHMRIHHNGAQRIDNETEDWDKYRETTKKAREEGDMTAAKRMASEAAASTQTG